MRYDAVEHVARWAKTGQYPAIHDAMFHAIGAWASGRSALDLCCSTGLLGQRVASKLGLAVVGVDCDRRALEAGRHVVTVPLVELRVEAETLPRIAEILNEYHVDILLARRCIPELFAYDLDLGHAFAGVLAVSGVREIFLEGRAASPRAVNPLATVEAEVGVFTDHYRQIRKLGQVVYLRRMT
jgi:SAM-dependent methyltransferase